MDEAECARKFKIDLAFRMLSVGRTDLVPHALQLLPSTKVSSRNGIEYLSVHSVILIDE